LSTFYQLRTGETPALQVFHQKVKQFDILICCPSLSITFCSRNQAGNLLSLFD